MSQELLLYIWHRHCSPKPGGLITNESHGDDTWLLSGTTEYLRAYALEGLERLENEPRCSDWLRGHQLYTQVLDLLDTADLSYYEAPACAYCERPGREYYRNHDTEPGPVVLCPSCYSAVRAAQGTTVIDYSLADK